MTHEPLKPTARIFLPHHNNYTGTGQIGSRESVICRSKNPVERLAAILHADTKRGSAEIPTNSVNWVEFEEQGVGHNDKEQKPSRTGGIPPAGARQFA